MKLSVKFFCIAYGAVLLAAGLTGSLLIRQVSDTLWNTRFQQVEDAGHYAAGSFMSLTALMSEELTPAVRDDLTRQIFQAVDRTVNRVEIHTAETANPSWQNLKENEGLSAVTDGKSAVTMTVVCRLHRQNIPYFIVVYADFTDIRQQIHSLWLSYSLIVLLFAAVSGALLYGAAVRVARPLSRLAAAANRMAAGSYGETVEESCRDWEVQQLTSSFNIMSRSVQSSMAALQDEYQRRSLFLGDFTHEMKTPMTAILGYADMLHSYDLSDEEKARAAAAISREAKRLESLSQNMLELLVLQNDSIPLGPVSLPNLAAQLRDTLLFPSQKYGVSVTVNFPDMTVMGSQDFLLSLLYNLADNGFKASEKGQRVRISAAVENRKVVFSVVDEGRGIDPDHIRFLQDPFYREDKSRSRAMGGAGLGLSLCREIARIHHSRLHFESHPGKGTTVSFALDLGGDDHE